MNFQMNEFHGIGIRDITAPFSDDFHKEQTWACLDNINEIHAPSPWKLIGFLLVLKCACSHCTHANEQDIGVDDYRSLNPKCPPFHILIHHRLQ